MQLGLEMGASWRLAGAFPTAGLSVAGSGGLRATCSSPSQQHRSYLRKGKGIPHHMGNLQPTSPAEWIVLYRSLFLLLLPQRDAQLPAVPCGGQTSRKAEWPCGQGGLHHQRLCEREGETRPCSPQVTQVGARAVRGVTPTQGDGRGGVGDCLPRPWGLQDLGMG